MFFKIGRIRIQSTDTKKSCLLPCMKHNQTCICCELIKEHDSIMDKPAKGFSLGWRPCRVVVLFILVHPHLRGPSGVPAWTQTQHLLRHSNDSVVGIPAVNFNDTREPSDTSWKNISISVSSLILHPVYLQHVKTNKKMKCFGLFHNNPRQDVGSGGNSSWYMDCGGKSVLSSKDDGQQ